MNEIAITRRRLNQRHESRSFWCDLPSVETSKSRSYLSFNEATMAGRDSLPAVQLIYRPRLRGSCAAMPRRRLGFCAISMRSGHDWLGTLSAVLHSPSYLHIALVTAMGALAHASSLKTEVNVSSWWLEGTAGRGKTFPFDWSVNFT